MLLCGARVSGEVVMRWTKGIWYQSWMKYAIMRRYMPNPVNTGVGWFPRASAGAHSRVTDVVAGLSASNGPSMLPPRPAVSKMVVRRTYAAVHPLS